MSAARLGASPPAIVARIATLLLALAACCAAAAEPPPRKHALVIGIDRYRYESAPEAQVPALQFAVADMRSVGAALEAQGFLVTPLANEDATRERIVTELVRLAAEADAEDTVLVYYAGHGGVVGGTTYWLNHDGHPKRPDVAGLRVLHMLDYLREIKAKYKIILLDHCYSAVIDPAEVQRLTALVTADDVAAPAEDADGSRQIAIAETREVVDARRGGAVFIAASRGVARETAESGHGIFTYAFLKSLSDPDVETVAVDGVVTADELYDYVSHHTFELGRASAFTQHVFGLDEVPFELKNDFTPFLIELPQSAVAARADALQATLESWLNTSKLKQAEFDFCKDVLTRWREYGVLVDPVEVELLRAIRELASRRTHDQGAARAKRLQRVISYLLEARA